MANRKPTLEEAEEMQMLQAFHPKYALNQAQLTDAFVDDILPNAMELDNAAMEAIRGDSLSEKSPRSNSNNSESPPRGSSPQEDLVTCSV